jgi:hypothetical protein
MRQTYIVEANAKPKSSSQKIGGDEVEQMIVVIAIDRAWLRLLVGTSGPGSGVRKLVGAITVTESASFHTSISLLWTHLAFQRRQTFPPYRLG